jgi:hypothetical protein
MFGICCERSRKEMRLNVSVESSTDATTARGFAPESEQAKKWFFTDFRETRL